MTEREQQILMNHRDALCDQMAELETMLRDATGEDLGPYSVKRQVIRLIEQRDEARAESARLAAALERFTNYHTRRMEIVTSALTSVTANGGDLRAEDWDNAVSALAGSRAALDATIEAAVKKTRELWSREHEDAMIASQWFARHFGEMMNGRDFAVKCPMADRELDALIARERRMAAEEELVALKKWVIGETIDSVFKAIDERVVALREGKKPKPTLTEIAEWLDNIHHCDIDEQRIIDNSVAALRER
jgi:hypothetical protein